MITRSADFTNNFNSTQYSNPSGSTLNIDISGVDYILVQIIGINGTVQFNATLNGGGQETGGNPESATNWTPVQGTNLGTGSAVTSTAASGLYQFHVVGKYLQITGNGAAVTITKLLVLFVKTSI